MEEPFTPPVKVLTAPQSIFSRSTKAVRYVVAYSLAMGIGVSGNLEKHSHSSSTRWFVGGVTTPQYRSYEVLNLPAGACTALSLSSVGCENFVVRWWTGVR